MSAMSGKQNQYKKSNQIEKTFSKQNQVNSKNRFRKKHFKTHKKIKTKNDFVCWLVATVLII